MRPVGGEAGSGEAGRGKSGCFCGNGCLENKTNRRTTYLMWVRSAAAVCCARVVLAFNALNALGRWGVAYELQFTSVARSGGKLKRVALENTSVRLLRFTVWIKCQRVVGEGVTSLFVVFVFAEVGGSEVLPILGTYHVVGAFAATLRHPCAHNWACFLVFTAVTGARHKRQTCNQYHEHSGKLQGAIF